MVTLEQLGQYFNVTGGGYTTLLIMGGCALALIGWDIYVVCTQSKQNHNSISEITNLQARLHPVIPFLFGALMGHLFWAQHICTPGCMPR